MHVRWLALAATLAAGGALLSPGCKSGTQTLDNSCETNVDCVIPGTRCNLETKQCVCATSEACPEGSFCNTAGVCQVRTGCTVNADCGAGTFCDIETGNCLAEPSVQLGSACGIAAHCPYGTLCVAGTCQVGCFDDGDCPLHDICLEGRCVTGDGLCSIKEGCEFCEDCIGNQCKRDRRGPYCRGCTFRTATNPNPCDNPRNFCLVNNNEVGGHAQFCGVDCSLGQTCPNGYTCGDVLILTDQVCFSQAQCKCDRTSIQAATSSCAVATPCAPRLPNGQPDPNAAGCSIVGHPSCNVGSSTITATCFVARGQTVGSCTCRSDADCSDGSTCVFGQCCGRVTKPGAECAAGESNVSGFCTCVTDEDCPRDSCDPSNGACAITGKPCTVGGNECGPIPCVGGACLIGQNCAPEQGSGCLTVGCAR